MSDETKSQKKISETKLANQAGKSQSLYAARKNIYPKNVKGFFRNLKSRLLFLTLGIYVITPWLRWDRGEYAPEQLILIDIASRRFYLAFIEIWPQEFYYVAGLLVMAGVGLFLTTSAVGRAWCGYTCPQTVWTDLFIFVEERVEGDRNARIKLDNAPWSASKLAKRVLKHTIWLLISVLTGTAFTLYFAPAPQLVVDLVTLQAAPAAYITIAILTASTYIFAAFMREQLCIYACPWPRIQGAMLDEHSLTVTYNDWRGEPRSKNSKKQIAAGVLVGDCVDCDACVAVCPTGIDIRDGQQLECITCALCIDACDNVMDKLGKERGLISYATFSQYNDNMSIATAGAYGHEGTPGQEVVKHIDPKLVRKGGAGKLRNIFGHTDWRTIIRPRTLMYFSVWGAIGLGMLVVLAFRSPLDINVLHDRNPLFVQLSDGTISNGYSVKLLNMTPIPRTVELSIEGLPGAVMSLAGNGEVAQDSLILDIEPDRVLPVRLYIRANPKQLAEGRNGFIMNIKNIAADEGASANVFFETPEG